MKYRIVPVGDIRACPYYYAYTVRHNSRGSNESVGYEKIARFTCFNNTNRLACPLTLKQVPVDNIFRHLHMPPELACEFLATFSRMEYALKSTKYADGDDKKVDPAWDCFANDIHEAFEEIEEPDLVKAKNYLLSHPPRKQTLAGNKITFIEQAIDAKQRTSQQLLLMVRTVRNNLFHGGKYLPDGEQEEGRNNLLVKHSLTVLLACSKLDHEVRSSFEH